MDCLDYYSKGVEGMEFFDRLLFFYPFAVPLRRLGKDYDYSVNFDELVYTDSIVCDQTSKHFVRNRNPESYELAEI